MTVPGNIGILIISCDSYSDTWDPFFHFFEKYWPDCPYSIYLATNSKLYHRKNINLIHFNKSTNWTDETRTALEKFPHNYFLHLLDDALLTKKVDSALIDSLFKKMLFYKADHLRLFPSPGPDRGIANEDEIGIIDENAPYRTCLQAALWKKSSFLSLLKEEENPWGFEINSPSRSKEYFCLSVKRQKKGHIKTHTYPITYYHKTGILKGKWLQGAVEMCTDEGVKLDLKYRKMETSVERWRRNSPKFLQHIYDFITNKYKKIIGNF